MARDGGVASRQIHVRCVRAAPGPTCCVARDSRRATHLVGHLPSYNIHVGYAKECFTAEPSVVFRAKRDKKLKALKLNNKVRRGHNATCVRGGA